MWHLYLLECQDGSFYTGITTNIEKRMYAHAKGTGSKYVASRGFKSLINSKPYLTQSDALKAEYRLKQLAKEQKEAWFEK